MPHFGPVHSWSPQAVSRWISGLHPLARQHAGVLLQHNMSGAPLLALTWSSLDSMRIIGMYDQEALLSAISILRDVDSSNKNYLIYPLAVRAMRSAKEALDHISNLKLHKRDLAAKQELYMSCINCGNLTRIILLHMDKYHIVYREKAKMAHELLCTLYSISHAAQQLKYGLRAVGIHVPDIPQELPYGMRNSNFASCLQASLSSLIENTTYIKECTEVKSRGCPTFERITLQPDGDTGWGFSFRETSSGIYIIKRILANTPADKSGRIKSGDEVIEVNDQNIVGWKIKNVVELIRSHPVGLVMVVRHYPDTDTTDITPTNPPTPQTPVPQTPLTPLARGCGPFSYQSQTLPHPRHHHVSGTFSEPLTSAADTPKKPPRPLDSVLRERCKSNNELDQHFKTVHNPKRLSQIYGENNFKFLTFDDVLYPENGCIEQDGEYLSTTSPPPGRGKRSNPTPPAHHRRNSSNPLDKYNIVSNRDWLDHIKQRGERSRNISQYKYGTGPRVRTTVPLDFIKMSMPDIAVSTENVQTADKSTGSDEQMDTTITVLSNHVTSLNNHVTSHNNHVTSSHNNHVMSPRNSNHVTPPNSNHVMSPRNSNHVTPPNSNYVTPPNSNHVTPPNSNHVTPPNNNHVTPPNGNHVTPPNSNHVTPNRKMDVVKNLALYCDKLSDEENLSEDTDSIATTPSTISNCTSVMTTDSTTSCRSKTLPRRNKTAEEDVGEFKNYPVPKESNYTTVVIGGVVHKIPVPTAAAPSSEEDNNSVKCNTIKNRKRQNKRSSWSISSDKAATLPKNIRFSLADLEENGTLKKKKNKKPSRSTSSILGDTNVCCKALYPNACEGWLLKLGGSGLTPRNWRRRWFVLKGFCLYYFKTPQDNTALGVITLPSFNIAIAPEIKKKNAFKASHKNTRTYYFISDSAEDKQRWMDKMLLASILYDESDKESGYGTGASPVATEVCSMTIEQSIISPCASLQSISSTTVV